MQKLWELRERLRAVWQETATRFARLTPRERRLVVGVGGAVGVFVLFLIFISFTTGAASTRRRTQEKLRKLGEVQALAQSYREAEAAREAVEQQLSQSDVRLLTYVQEKGEASGLPVPTMNPKPAVELADGAIVENAVEVTLTDITLRDLTTFLSNIEAGPGVVKVKFLRVEPRPANGNLTAWATIATYRMKQ